MRLLASVRTNMAGLVLETVEGLLAQRAFVWSREVVTLVVVGLCVLEQRCHEAHCGGGHRRLSGGVDSGVGIEAGVGGGRVLTLLGRIVAGRGL